MVNANLHIDSEVTSALSAFLHSEFLMPNPNNVGMKSQKEVKDLVALGVQKAKEGDFRGSVELMSSAAKKSPDNPQVVLNAALAALKCIENLGWDPATGGLAKQLIESAARLDPMNSRLKAIRSLYGELQKRYGIDAVRTKLT